MYLPAPAGDGGFSNLQAASRWAESQLFGIRATDPATVGLVTLVVVAAAMLAAWHPARRAAAVDPKALLRN